MLSLRTCHAIVIESCDRYTREKLQVKKTLSSSERVPQLILFSCILKSRAETERGEHRAPSFDA